MSEKISVIGLGMVGGAVYRYFHERYKGEEQMVFGYDINPSLACDTWAQNLETDYMFLCLPSETARDGSQDLKALEAVLNQLALDRYEGIVVIKSTVVPGTTKGLQVLFPSLKLTHNPEFLTAANAYDDFVRQPAILVSGQWAEDVCCLYRKFFYCKCIATPDTNITELAKYMHNVFLSVKVGWCNEFYKLCENVSQNSYDEVRQLACLMGGIGLGHTKVPGPDGRFGFGGACFPKDTQALQRFMADNNLTHGILKATIDQNIERNEEYFSGVR